MSDLASYLVHDPVRKILIQIFVLISVIVCHKKEFQRLSFALDIENCAISSSW